MKLQNKIYYMYFSLNMLYMTKYAHTHTHRQNPFYGPPDFVRDYPGEPVPEPIWILPKQEIVSGSGIS